MVHLEEKIDRYKTNTNGDDDYVNQARASKKARLVKN